MHVHSDRLCAKGISVLGSLSEMIDEVLCVWLDDIWYVVMCFFIPAPSVANLNIGDGFDHPYRFLEVSKTSYIVFSFSPLMVYALECTGPVLCSAGMVKVFQSLFLTSF